MTTVAPISDNLGQLIVPLEMAAVLYAIFVVGLSGSCLTNNKCQASMYVSNMVTNVIQTMDAQIITFLADLCKLNMHYPLGVRIVRLIVCSFLISSRILI